MITFILLAVGAIIAVAAILVAYTANQRKRSGQSGQSEAAAQVHHTSEPTIGRPTGVN